MAWSFAYWLKNTTFTLPLCKIFTAIAFGICVLINIKICFGSASIAFNIQTLTVGFINVMLGGGG